eukprot:gene6347-7891_t
MAFTGTSVDLVRLRESFCAVTAPTPVQPIGQALVVEMGAEPVIIAEEDRAVYAEAIDTATSFSVAIVGQAVGLLAKLGVDSPGTVLAPLVRSSVENALAGSGADTIEFGRVVRSIAELRAILADAETVALVPTMGALHEGHLALIRHATKRAETVVVSIFVNPLQFDQSDDLGRYPRTLDADLAAIAPWPETIVFAPDVAELYPHTPIQTTVAGGPV